MTGDLREAMRKAQLAHGVDPDAVAEQAALVDLDAPEPSAADSDPPSSEEAAEQLPLSDPDADEIGKWQAGDHDTQRLAALQAYPSTGSARRRVLDAIGESMPHGMTDEELQEQLQMNPSTQRPRRVELVEGGWIEDSTRRRLTYTKREAVVWVLTLNGKRSWSRSEP